MADSGHGVRVFYEADPVGAPGAFTEVGRLVGDFDIIFTRAETLALQHNNNIGVYSPGMLMMDAFPFEVNYDKGDATHEGLRTHMLNGTKFLLRFWGRGGGAGDDELIMRGFLSRWHNLSPLGDGTRTAGGTFRQSGAISIDGVVYGGAAVGDE